MINYLFFGITYSLACVVQPGPFQAFLFSQSLTNGWRKTVPLVFAPLISDLPIIILVVFVLTKIPPVALGILQCLGGAFLLYLAVEAWKAWRKFSQYTTQDFSPRQNIFKAALINFLNPNPYLGWSLVMGPLLIKGWCKDPANGIILLIGFYSSMIIYSIGMVVVFAAARNLGPQISRRAIGMSALAFVIFGLYQLWAGITQFFQLI